MRNHWGRVKCEVRTPDKRAIRDFHPKTHRNELTWWYLTTTVCTLPAWLVMQKPQKQQVSTTPTKPQQKDINHLPPEACFHQRTLQRVCFWNEVAAFGCANVCQITAIWQHHCPHEQRGYFLYFLRWVPAWPHAVSRFLCVSTFLRKKWTCRVCREKQSRQLPKKTNTVRDPSGWTQTEVHISQFGNMIGFWYAEYKLIRDLAGFEPVTTCFQRRCKLPPEAKGQEGGSCEITVLN